MQVGHHGIWCWASLTSIVVVGCHGGTAPTRSTSTSPPVPTSRSAPLFARSDGGDLGFRGDLHRFSVCLEECIRLDALCHGATPECVEIDRQLAVLDDLHRRDAGARVARAIALASVYSSEASGACLRRCGEPHRLCMNRCNNGPEDAGRPLQ